MKNSSSRNIAGLILILLGVLWFLSTTHMFYFDVWDYFWPSVFLGIGVILAVKGRALVLATVFIFFGGLNLISNLFYVNFDYMFDRFWPLLLIGLGLLILFRRKDGRWERRERRHNKWERHNKGSKENSNLYQNNVNEWKKDNESAPQTESGADTKTEPAAETASESKSESSSSSKTGYDYSYKYNYDYKFHQSDFATSTDADRIDEVAILTSIRKNVTSQNFKGGEVKTIMGGGILDFTSAKLAEGENIIDLTSIMGGVTFRVPQEWKVIVNVHSVFGGFEDKRRFFTPAVPNSNCTLIIRGTVIMGGGTITY